MISILQLNESFYLEGGRVRGVPVTIDGSSYAPSIPGESVVKESIDRIVTSDKEPISIAIEFCLYCMKTQTFIDGNKRAVVIFANQYLIVQGQGFIVIQENLYIQSPHLESVPRRIRTTLTGTKPIDPIHIPNTFHLLK